MESNLIEAKKVFDNEIDALMKTRDALGETFTEILQLVVNCKGKVVVTGMGKPGHIARKIAATFASLGTPAFFLHPAEAMHGDLGMVSSEDVVVVISYSGESDEIIGILPNIKILGAKIIGITGNVESTLAREADVLQILPEFSEAGNMEIAPTSSTTAALCYGDALAVVASQIYGFTEADFGRFHPAGALGKKIILKVRDLMVVEEKNAVIYQNQSLKDLVMELSIKGLGIVTVIDKNRHIIGVVTNADLRMQLEKGIDIYSLKVEQIMSHNPIVVQEDKMAVEVLKLMKEKHVVSIPVLKKEEAVGTIRFQDVIGAGIVG